MSSVFEVTSVEHAPPELAQQVPFTARLLRQIPGPNRPDYWLAELDSPLRWEEQSDTPQMISHLIIASRYTGTTVTDHMRGLWIGISYVVDDSVLKDDTLDFVKCRYVAIGSATSHGDPSS